MSEINTWPGWNFVKQIGYGSYGKVFEIEQNIYGVTKKAALKVLSIPSTKGEIEEGFENGDYDTIKEATYFYENKIEEAIREFELMAKFKSITNIVHCESYKVIPHDGWIGADILIRMELLTPLSRYHSFHNINEADVIRIGIDVCSALSACHKAVPQILHRDVKPANILVDEQGNYKLADFGVARTVEGTKSAHTIAGTEEYMAPEVLKGEGYEATADIYSLGVVLYKLLNNNRSPFLPLEGVLNQEMRNEAKTKRIRGEKLPAPHLGSQKLKNAIMKAVEFEPIERWQTADKFRCELEQCIEREQVFVDVFEDEEEEETVYEKKFSKNRKPDKYKKRVSQLVLTDYNSGIKFVVDKSRYIIGRGEGVYVDGLISYNEHISRTHCEIIYSDGRYYVNDLDSMNGTFLNQSRLKPFIKYSLMNGDRLKLANLFLEVEIETNYNEY